MSDKFIENMYVVLYALGDMWAAFKAVVFVICTVLSIWLVYENTNMLITISVFLLIPVLVGTIWARLYKDAFERGAVTLKDVEDKKEEK